MNTNSLITLRPYSAGNFVGVQLSTEIKATDENKLEEQSRFDHVWDVIHRLLGPGSRRVQQSDSSRRHFPSLAEAFAEVPADSGHDSSENFKVVVHGHEKPLKYELREQIYAIGREAIINALRHSRAKVIEMKVEYRATELRISVRDDGRGIDSQALRWGPEATLGLQEMRDRAEKIGARLRLRSGVALGTEVELCVPARIAFGQSS